MENQFFQIVKKIVKAIGFPRTNALVREATEEICVEEISKRRPQKEVAEELGISVPTVSGYIRGKVQPLPLGRRRLEDGGRTFKKSSGIDHPESYIDQAPKESKKKLKIRKKK